MRTFRLLIGAGAAAALRYPGDDQPILDSAASERNTRFLGVADLTAAARANGALFDAERRSDLSEVLVRTPAFAGARLGCRFVRCACNDFLVCFDDLPKLEKASSTISLGFQMTSNLPMC